ncbi:signal peptide peptidase SppA [Candidatus Marinamargulisbacteria bacterium SCGC AG-439-L15]|nr:signal peptide peptidase SppA [Candidatus Marinamargulisbacteria bacterium SCGC AG-439-L15]
MKRFKEYIVVGGLVLLFLLAIVGNRQDAKKSGSMIQAGSVLSPKLPAVAVVPLYGMIETSPSEFFDAYGVTGVMETLREYEANKQVKAIILRINSPGGHVGTSQELYHYIVNFKKRSKKPVVVSIVDYGASGAYWIALAGDKVFANPGSLVGSMGVITQTMDLTKVKEKYGVGVNTYKSGAMKDILNPWRSANIQEKKIVQNMLGNLHNQFVKVVIKERKLKKKTVHKLADGRAYTGEQALRLGLVDQLGGLEDAIAEAGKLAGIKGRPEVFYQRQSGFQQIFSSFKGQLKIMDTSIFSAFPSLMVR